MSSHELLEVLSPGFHSSLQDAGRLGLAHLGIAAGGAADPIAFTLGNRLVGNQDSAAAIEMTINGGNFRFTRAAWVAITGTAKEVRIDQHVISTWTTYHIQEGQTLSIGSCSGARAYLCVHGGLEVPKLLGSRSTDVSGRWGGLLGRALVSGDRLGQARDEIASPGPRRAGIRMRTHYNQEARLVLRVTRGPQIGMFDSQTSARFFDTRWTVTPEADRKGLRLEGAEVAATNNSELRSEGVSWGAVQVPSSGQPIILFCEQGTTGGYPKIANVIRADWYKLGQLMPGDQFGFEEVSLEQAWNLAEDWKETCRRSVLPL